MIFYSKDAPPVEYDNYTILKDIENAIDHYIENHGFTPDKILLTIEHKNKIISNNRSEIHRMTGGSGIASFEDLRFCLQVKEIPPFEIIEKPKL